MTRRAQWGLVSSGVVLTLILDQITKIVAGDALAGRPPQEYLGGFLRLGYVENPGAFLSLGAGLPASARQIVFVALVGIALAAALAFALWPGKTTRSQALALSLVVGGGFSNLIDRLLNEGRVIDFLNLGLGPVRTGVFNVADVAITMALLFLLAEGLIFRRRKPDQA